MLSNVFPKLIDIHYSLKLVLIEVAKLFYSIIYHILPNKSLMWKKRAHWNSISFYCLGTLCSIWGLSQREDTSRLSWNRFQGVPCQLYSGNYPSPLSGSRGFLVCLTQVMSLPLGSKGFLVCLTQVIYLPPSGSSGFLVILTYVISPHPTLSFQGVPCQP